MRLSLTVTGRGPIQDRASVGCETFWPNIGAIKPCCHSKAFLDVTDIFQELFDTSITYDRTLEKFKFRYLI